jgi:hypothetical protein
MSLAHAPTIRFTVEGAAAYTGFSVSFLNKRRVYGGGPIFIKAGRLVMYEQADIDAWLRSCRRTSTSAKAEAA